MESLDLKGPRPGRGIRGEGLKKQRMQGQGWACVPGSARHRNRPFPGVRNRSGQAVGLPLVGFQAAASLMKKILLDKKALSEPLRHMCLQLPHSCLQRFLGRVTPRAHSLLQSCDSWHFYLLKLQFPHLSKGRNNPQPKDINSPQKQIYKCEHTYKSLNLIT